MKKQQAEKKRIVVDNDGKIHTIPEQLYLEIDQAVKNGTSTSYLMHPDKIIRLLAELRTKTLRGVR